LREQALRHRLFSTATSSDDDLFVRLRVMPVAMAPMMQPLLIRIGTITAPGSESAAGRFAKTVALGRLCASETVVALKRTAIDAMTVFNVMARSPYPPITRQHAFGSATPAFRVFLKADHLTTSAAIRQG
jgi:hypothetical protein